MTMSGGITHWNMGNLQLAMSLLNIASNSPGTIDHPQEELKLQPMLKY